MDIIDATDRDMEQHDKAMREHIRKIAAGIPKGSPGECIECGEYNQRLVNGVCSPCRDYLAGIK